MWASINKSDLSLTTPFTHERARTSKKTSGTPGFVFFDAGNVILDLDWDSYFEATGQLVVNTPIQFSIESFTKSMFKSGLAKQWSCGLIGNALFADGLKKLLTEEFSIEPHDAENISPQQLKAISSLVVGPPRMRVFEMIKKLKQQGFLIGLLSNCNPWHEIDIERNRTLYDLFDTVVYSHDVGCEKPDALIYEKATKLAQATVKTKRDVSLSKEDIYFVDDLPANVRAALAYGWNAKLVCVVRDEILNEFTSSKMTEEEFSSLSTKARSLFCGDAAARRVEGLFKNLTGAL